MYLCVHLCWSSDCTQPGGVRCTAPLRLVLGTMKVQLVDYAALQMSGEVQIVKFQVCIRHHNCLHIVCTMTNYKLKHGAAPFNAQGCLIASCCTMHVCGLHLRGAPRSVDVVCALLADGCARVAPGLLLVLVLPQHSLRSWYREGMGVGNRCLLEASSPAIVCWGL